MKPFCHRRTAGAVLVIGTMLFPGCTGGASQPTKSIDVSPSIEIQRQGVPLGSAVEITYGWTVGSAFEGLTGEHSAFVHFIDAEGRILFADDHVPTPAPSVWKRGESHTYTRTRFVPLYPYVGPVQVLMGLFPSDGGQRLGLKGEDAARQAYVVGSVEILPQTENLFLVYKEGWHSPEPMLEDPAQERTWTKKRAVVSFKTPKEDLILYLRADTNREAFSEPPVLTVSAAGYGLRIPIKDSEVFLKKIRFPAEALDAQDWINVELAMDQSFVPEELGMGDDPRELGLRVYNLYLGEEDQLGGNLENVVDATKLD